jgi:hypothetical protein
VENSNKLIQRDTGHTRSSREAPAEEATLVDFLEESGACGFPQTLQNIEHYANLIRRGSLGSDCEDVGQHWAARFLDRHHDRICTTWSKPLDTQRARAMNPEAKKKWFELLDEFLVKAGVAPENIYAMDEMGCPPSDQGTERVLSSRGTKTQHRQGGADRENVTALLTICANGTVLRPMIIFKGRNFMQKWQQDNVSGAS